MTTEAWIVQCIDGNIMLAESRQTALTLAFGWLLANVPPLPGLDFVNITKLVPQVWTRGEVTTVALLTDNVTIWKQEIQS